MDRIQQSRIHTNTLLSLTFVVSACSIMYEVLIAHSLALLAANAIVWYSLVIGCYLLGMGLGSLVVDRVRRFQDGALWSLCGVEILLSLAGLLAIPLLHSTHSLYSYLRVLDSRDLGLSIFFGSSLLYTVLIGVLTGIELPLLIRVGKSLAPSGRLTNRLLGFDYLGALVGAVLFPTVLLVHFSTLMLGAIVAAINLLIALLLILHLRGSKYSIRGLTGGAFVVGAAIFISMFFEADIEQFFLKRYYSQRYFARSLEQFLSLGTEYPDVLRVRSRYQTIDIIEDLEGDGSDAFVRAFSSKLSRHPDWPQNRLLFLNGDWQFHSSHEEVYHEFFTHVPIISTGKVPENVLVLGGGDGLLIRELLRYSEIRSITHVDLDKELIRLSKTNEMLLRVNQRSLFDPRVRTIIADGLRYVREQDKTFDAIYIDFPTPTDYNLAKLYSREFYHFVRKRLNPGGFMVFDAVSVGALTYPDEHGNQELRKVNRWENYYHTLKAAGFTRIVPYLASLGFKNELATNMARGSIPEDQIQHRINRYVKHRQEGFIIAGMPGTLFGHPFRKPPGPELFVLNEERYRLAFKKQFPQSETLDQAKVNSIFQPVFPILPVWNARLPL